MASLPYPLWVSLPQNDIPPMGIPQAALDSREVRRRRLGVRCRPAGPRPRMRRSCEPARPGGSVLIARSRIQRRVSGAPPPGGSGAALIRQRGLGSGQPAHAGTARGAFPVHGVVHLGSDASDGLLAIRVDREQSVEVSCWASRNRCSSPGSSSAVERVQATGHGPSVPKPERGLGWTGGHRRGVPGLPDRDRIRECERLGASGRDLRAVGTAGSAFPVWPCGSGYS